MSLSPDDDLFDENTVPTPKIKLEDEFISSQQEKMNVYLRIRPLLPGEILQDNRMCIYAEDDHTVRAVAPLDSAKFKSSAHDNSALGQIFSFTRTFGPEVDQIKFFEETMKTTLENFIRGQNELVFAYGSTGSGKTYTMQGGLSGTRPGVIPSTLYLLFGSIKGRQVMSPLFKPHKYSDVIKLSKWEQECEETARENLLSRVDSEDFDDSKSLSGKSSVSISTIFSDDSLDVTSHSNLTDKEISTLESTLRMKNIACDSVSMQGEEVLFSIWVSFVEVYNENIFDLLEPVTSNKRTRLSLNEDKNKNIYVKGLREIRVTSSEEALKVFSFGKKNLRIASTKMNYQSSRSHCIFTIKIIRVLGTDSPLSARVNRLSYCDLAGSERTAKTQNTGIRLKEAGKINTSLLVLGRCIESLRQQGPKDKNIVPYRDSKLTRMFSAYFTGKGKASMIINVSPASQVFDETFNVLKFSALAKQVASNDLSLRPLSHWNKEISRLTETWEKSCSRWSSFCKSDSQKDSLNIISETSMEDENVIDESYDEVIQRDQIIEKLIEHVKTLSDELKKVLIEKENLEGEIRAQVCREFAENFVQIDNCYREQLKDLQESDLTVDLQIREELKSDVSKDADEEDNGEDSGDDSDDEKEYASADEDAPPPSVSKAVKCSENELLEDKGSQEDEVKRYEALLSAKDEDIKELQRTVEEQKNAMISVEKKVEELERTAKSKDVDSDALRIKMKENELAFESKMTELKNIINERNDEINQLKEKFESEIASKEKKLQECNTIISLKEVEISFLKRYDESKEDELKKWEIKDAEVTELKRNIEKLQEDVASKEKEIKDYKNIVSLKNTEVQSLQEKMEEIQDKIEENEVVVLNPMLLEPEETVKSKDESIAQLKKEVEDHLKSISFKDKELEECRNNLNSKEQELFALKQKLEVHEVVPKNSELKEYKKSLNSKEAEIMKLKKKIDDLEGSVISKDELIKDLEKNVKKTEEMLSSKNAEVPELYQKLSSVENTESEDGPIKMCDKEGGKAGEMCHGDKKIVELQEKIASVNSEALSKIPEWENVQCLTKQVQELSETLASQHAKLSTMGKKYDDLVEQVEEGKKIIQQEFNKTCEEKDELLSKKSDEIKELQCRLDEKEQEFSKKLEEQERSLLERNDMIKELEHKLECKLIEEEKSKEQRAIDENQIKILGDLVKVLQQAEFHSNNMTIDLKTKVRELISETKEKEGEKEQAEDKKRKSIEKREMERTEEEIQIENSEPQEHEKEVNTKHSEVEKISVDGGDSQCKIIQPSYNKKFKHTTTQEERRLARKRAYKECHNDEESERIDPYEEEESYEADSDTSLQMQVSFAESLVSCLQWIEMIAAQTIVKLSSENKNYCKKLLGLSEDLEVTRAKLVAAELKTTEERNSHRKSKTENFALEPEQDLTMDNKESLHLLETLQKINHLSTKSIGKLSEENLRLVHENKAFFEQVQAFSADLELVNKEIERKDKEYCKIQNQLKKKETSIACLESEIFEAQKKLGKLETESKIQLLQEQTQHGIEVEHVVALKRQVETDYRNLEKKFKAVTECVEEPAQRRKRGPPRRCKGRKRTSAEGDEDFVPYQKKRIVKSQTCFEEEDTSICSVEAEQSRKTETPSSFHRLHEFVEKSPVIKAVAQRMATFLSPKSSNDDSNSSAVKRRKRKLFNSACAAPLITSPVQEAARKISPKKTVSRRFRSKKDSK